MITEVRTDRIKIGDRVRKDMGDLSKLKGSMQQMGLLQPIGLNSEYALIWGERRLTAARELGWETIMANVDPSMDDVANAINAEFVENDVRKDFTPSEAVVMSKRFKEIMAPVVKKALAKSPGRPQKHIEPSNDPMRSDVELESTQKKGGANCPTFSSRPPKPKQRDESKRLNEMAAKSVGMGRRTLEAARKVVDNGSPKLVEAMDRKQVSVNAASHLATLPKPEQDRVVEQGPEVSREIAKQIKEDRKLEPVEPDGNPIPSKTKAEMLEDIRKRNLELNPDKQIALKWLKTMTKAMSPISGIRSELGGGDVWARKLHPENRRRVLNGIKHVIKGYEELALSIERVINEESQ